MRIVMVGFGNVGQALARILLKDMSRIVESHGFEPKVTMIMDSQGSCMSGQGLDLAQVLKVKEKYGTVAKYPGKSNWDSNTASTISDVEAEVLVETTPSNFQDGEPGLSNIKTALASGKHVVTANKGPLALAMPALLELANHKGMRLRFSGTVGGGTPFLDFAAKCLPGERIVTVRGILNGTSNYVLTRMEEASLSFKRALGEARAKGYAEADPTNDIRGFDTAAKIVIIANWILKQRMSIKGMSIEGIESVTPSQLKRAHASGSRVKLVGSLQDSKASVGPEKVALNDPVCVPGTLNAVTFSTEHAGDVTLIGPGAGGERTASAIIRDLVDIKNEFVL